MPTILHISDLHRSSDEPITNATLIAGLLADRDRFVTETPQVPLPDAIVVSGDIIQGTRLGAANWANEITKQYEVAYEFLSTLVDRMVGGDRGRLILVPGNHDVCWNTARSAMRPLAREHEPKNMPTALMEPGGRHRWSWDDRQVYEISDIGLYRTRLDAYWHFAERFYSGVHLAYPFTRGRGFNIFEIGAGQVVVAAFESVHGNDCFSFQGSISESAISQCGLTIRDACKPYLMRLATWHHSIQGPPERTDYMDVQLVHEMIGNGFRLGLHGHQHLAQAGAHYIHLPERQAMAVVSAGSLCAGARELPRGVDRQYNVIAIADDFLSARVHVREMGPGNHFGRSRRGPFFLTGSVDLKWERPADAVGRPVDPLANHTRDELLQAENRFKDGDFAAAEQHLRGLAIPPDSYARALFIQVSRAAKRWDLIISHLKELSNADDLVVVVEALLETRQEDTAATLLSEHAERLGLASHVREDLEGKIEVRQMLRSHSA